MELPWCTKLYNNSNNDDNNITHTDIWEIAMDSYNKLYSDSWIRIIINQADIIAKDIADFENDNLKNEKSKIIKNIVND